MSCKNSSPLDAMQTQRLWNDSETAVDEYLQGFVITHPGTIILKGLRAILRRDYAAMHGKVKLISGGGAGNEPTHAGFVGPGMLTAAIIGDVFSAPPSDSILKVIHELGTNHPPGYRISFGLARSKAQNEGLSVGMLTVGNDTCIKPFEKPAGRHGLAATLFIHKIAGAMAEEGKTLEEICDFCNEIMSSGGVASIGLCTKVPFSAGICSCTQHSGPEEMELGLGIHGESAVSRVCFTTAKDIVSQMIHIMIDDQTARGSMKLANNPDVSDANGVEIAVMINNLGGTSEIELGVVAMEVVQQLKSRGLHAKRIYVGTFVISLGTSGFQFSVLELSSHLYLKKYLDAPTAAPAWPKVLDLAALGQDLNKSSADTEVASLERVSKTTSTHGSGMPDIEPCGPILDERTAQVVLMILTFACEALISCSEELNIMDQDSGDGDCGTSLAQGVSAIKAAIREKQISGSRPFVTLRQIGSIIERVMGGIIGGLYSLFFDAGAKEFEKRSQKDPVDVCMWLNALAAGNKAIIEYGQVNVGDRTMLDPLIAAQDHLVAALKNNLHPISAFGAAVKAAESRAIETIKMPACVGRAGLVRCKQFEYPDPGAHAVGIWMRAVYEGVKLKMSYLYEDKCYNC